MHHATDPRTTAHHVHRSIHHRAFKQRGGVAGHGLKVTSKQGVHGFALIAEVSHLALGEHRAASGNRDDVPCSASQFVGFGHGQPELTGDLQDRLSRTRGALLVLDYPNAPLQISRDHAVTPGSKTHQVQRSLRKEAKPQRGTQTGFLGQCPDALRNGLPDVQTGYPQAHTIGDVPFLIPGVK